MTAKAPPRVTWVAAKDGIGHVAVKGSFNTLCGRRAVLERLAWPVTTRCLACRTKLDAAA